MAGTIKKKIKSRLKVNDEVIIISGKTRGQKGKILAMDLQRGRVIVQGVNLRKKFLRPTQQNPKGGSVEMEAPMHISNVQMLDSKSKKPSRIRMQVKDGKKLRIAVKSDKELG
ncbi:MAG: 50S ribosomal protein L24 [Spirochaetia bacterium]|nr:50S ribosomal protein L24 [Spirochaetia bacterium]